MSKYKFTNKTLSVIGSCIFISVFIVPALVWAGCAPGQYQAIYTGTLWNISLGDKDELRAYFVEEIPPPSQTETEEGGNTISAGEFSAENTSSMTNTSESEGTTEETDSGKPSKITYTYVGSTVDNPGSLRKKDNVLEFALYLCGDDLDNGKQLQFRYAKHGQTEYLAEVINGTPTFTGRKIDFITGIGNPESEDLVLKVTRNQPWIEHPVQKQQITVVEKTPKTPLKGDVNHDGRVDSSDAAIILQHILMSGEYRSDYDINGDKRVNDNDVRAIYLIMSGADKYLAYIPEVNANNVLRFILLGSGYEAQFDVNGDGKVDLDDVQRLYQQGETTSDGKVDGSIILQAIIVGDTDNKNLDLNQDGKVDMNDIRMLYQASNNSASPPDFDNIITVRMPDFSASFPQGPTEFGSVLEAVLFGSTYDKRYDINGDGKISLDDVKYVYTPGGTKQTDSNDTGALLRAIIFGGTYDSQFDLNGDGKIDLDDLHKLYE